MNTINNIRKIEIGSKIILPNGEIWTVIEIEDSEIRLGKDGQVKVFKR